MGRIRVQASQTQMAWQPLPRGTYNLQIDAVEEKTSRNNNPQLKFTMSVVDGPSAGKKATHFMTISEKSGGFVKEMIEATGIEYESEESEEICAEDGKPFMLYDFDSDDMIGKIVTADCTVSEYEGKENNRFNKFRAFDGGAEDEAPEAEEPAPKATPKSTAKPATTTAKAAAAPASKPVAGQQTRRARV